MAILTKQAILDALDLPVETVAVPEWGGEVLVRGMTGTERDSFEASLRREKAKAKGKAPDYEVDLSDFRSKLVARSVVDEDGKRLFSDDEIGSLGRKSAVALSRVADVAMRLSGFTESDIDELKKASTPGPNADSTSD